MWNSSNLFGVNKRSVFVKPAVFHFTFKENRLVFPRLGSSKYSNSWKRTENTQQVLPLAK